MQRGRSQDLRRNGRDEIVIPEQRLIERADVPETQHLAPQLKKRRQGSLRARSAQQHLELDASPKRRWENPDLIPAKVQQREAPQAAEIVRKGLQLVIGDIQPSQSNHAACVATGGDEPVASVRSRLTCILSM